MLYGHTVLLSVGTIIMQTSIYGSQPKGSTIVIGFFMSHCPLARPGYAMSHWVTTKTVLLL